MSTPRMSRSIVSTLATALLAAGLGTGCYIGAGEGAGASAGRTASYSRTAHPTITIPRFSGRVGVIRIFNTTGYTLSQVTIGVRGYGCVGPTPTRTLIRTFHTFLQPGAWRSYNFTLGYRCQRVAAATMGR